MEKTYETHFPNRVRDHSGVRRHRSLWRLIAAAFANEQHPTALLRKYAFGKLFIISAIFYLTNKAVLRFDMSVFGSDAPSVFMRNHFNDLFAMPVMLTLLIVLQQAWRLREDTEDFSVAEVVGWFAIWSMMFEVVLPAFGKGVSDWRDVLCYAAGGLVFLAVYRPALLPARIS